MKKLRNYDLLNEGKINELKKVREIIRKEGQGKVHMIILLILMKNPELNPEAKFEDEFNLMVIGEGETFQDDVDLDYAIQQRICRANSINTSVTIILQDIAWVNGQIKNGSRFHTHAVIEGYEVYDSGELELNESDENVKTESQTRWVLG